MGLHVTPYGTIYVQRSLRTGEVMQVLPVKRPATPSHLPSVDSLGITENFIEHRRASIAADQARTSRSQDRLQRELQTVGGERLLKAGKAALAQQDGGGCGGGEEGDGYSYGGNYDYGDSSGGGYGDGDPGSSQGRGRGGAAAAAATSIATSSTAGTATARTTAAPAIASTPSWHDSVLSRPHDRSGKSAATATTLSSAAAHSAARRPQELPVRPWSDAVSPRRVHLPPFRETDPARVVGLISQQDDGHGSGGGSGSGSGTANGANHLCSGTVLDNSNSNANTITTPTAMHKRNQRKRVHGSRDRGDRASSSGSSGSASICNHSILSGSWVGSNAHLRDSATTTSTLMPPYEKGGGGGVGKPPWQRRAKAHRSRSSSSCSNSNTSNDRPGHAGGKNQPAPSPSTGPRAMLPAVPSTDTSASSWSLLSSSPSPLSPQSTSATVAGTPLFSPGPSSVSVSSVSPVSSVSVSSVSSASVSSVSSVSVSSVSSVSTPPVSSACVSALSPVSPSASAAPAKNKTVWIIRMLEPRKPGRGGNHPDGHGSTVDDEPPQKVRTLVETHIHGESEEYLLLCGGEAMICR